MSHSLGRLGLKTRTTSTDVMCSHRHSDRPLIGYERRSGQAVLPLDFTDREPMMLAMPIAEGKKIAIALLQVDQGMQPKLN